MIDPALTSQIESLLSRGRIENLSDAKLLRWALDHQEEAAPSTVVWFEAVLARGGRRHPGPTPA